MQTVNIKDIQGFLISGYSHMRHARYSLLKVEDATLAKKWIGDLADDITDATGKTTKNCLNFAITYHGLLALGMYEENARNFSRPFREGMATSHRQRLLGDLDDSSPANWQWGGNTSSDKHKEENIHILLMVFGEDEETMLALYNEFEGNLPQNGLSLVTNLDGVLLKDNKEHFGFRDGISQPRIEGAGKQGNKNNTVKPGEFLLGYKNEYNVFPETPLITKPQGEMDLLANDDENPDKKNFGRNGTYLVFRQMQQDVDKFWTFINKQNQNPDGSLDEEGSIKMASKMIGRWPSGAPLAKFPDGDPGGLSNDDDFGYYDQDPDGRRCPFGSHLRRNNPRDAFEDNGAAHSIRLTKKHRIIRRGRSYGVPIVGSPTNHEYEGEVGLHFMCFNASLERQFEFVQHTWANYPHFQNLYSDPDPIIGTRQVAMEDTVQNFTIQATPVNQTVKDIEQFVVIKGGAYFFFPSIAAINYLATL
jgi:Dyp-type peroxidase family